MLWGRAANRCAFPNCRLELVMDASETDDEAFIGEECHIIARELDGPRGDHTIPIETRNKYSNLILLCSTHHTLIDKQPNTYTIENLQDMKAAHEKWVRESLQGFDLMKQRDDERYADYIEEWVKLVDLNNWRDWLFWLYFSDQPRITKEHFHSLIQLTYWLASRIWPLRYPELEAAFENFRRVLVDLLKVFEAHAFTMERSTHAEEEELDLDNIVYEINKFYR
jgi:HNH endonuclease